KCPVCGQVFQFRMAPESARPAPPDARAAATPAAAPPKARQDVPASRIPIGKPAPPAAGLAKPAATFPTAIPVAQPVGTHKPDASATRREPRLGTSMLEPGINLSPDMSPLVQASLGNAASPSRRKLYLGLGILFGAAAVIGAAMTIKVVYAP